MSKSIPLFAVLLFGAFCMTACTTPVSENREGVPAPTQAPSDESEVIQAPKDPVIQPAEMQTVGQAEPVKTEPGVVEVTDEPQTPVPGPVVEPNNGEVEAQDEIKPFVNQPVKLKTYKVKKGDTLAQIGYCYGVSAGEIAAQNNMKTSDVLVVGRTLELPAGAAYIPSEKRKPIKRQQPPKPKNKATTTSGSAQVATVSGDVYVVKAGDNPWTIARKLKVKTSDLLAVNNLTDKSVLQINQKLKIPGKSGSSLATVNNNTASGTSGNANVPAPGNATGSNTGAPETPVAPEKPVGGADLATAEPIYAMEGETLSKIANEFGIPLATLKQLNPNLSEDQPLRAGTQVKIPSYNY